MTASMQASTGWFPVARSADVDTTPVPVGADGEAYVVVRLEPGGAVRAFPARCPHRLVPLSAGSVVGGELQCPYHGWRFGSDGQCAEVPSLGPGVAPPPRASVTAPRVAERSGWVWLAPGPAEAQPPEPDIEPTPEPAPEPAPPAGRIFGNLEPSLEHAWHPVALASELADDDRLQVRLLGRTWQLRRTADG